jgi:predicted RND superfamily exporter protein
MSKFVIRHPRLIIAMVGLLTLFFGVGLRRGLILDVSPDGFAERDNQARSEFEAARKSFGPDDYLVVAVVCDDVFAPASLERLQALHEKILSTPGVAEVLSLINVPYARSTGEGASLEKLLPESFSDAGRLHEARQVATKDRLYLGNLVSSDSRTAAFNILFKGELSTTSRHGITAEIYQEVKRSGFSQSYFAGDPFSQWLGPESIKSDLKIFLPLTLIMIALLLWLCFRSFVAVVLPLATIGIGLFWLMGLMAFLNAHFTILALMLPTLMLAIGCS